MRHSNYDKYPATRIAGTVVQGWDNIIACIRQRLESENISGLKVFQMEYHSRCGCDCSTDAVRT